VGSVLCLGATAHFQFYDIYFSSVCVRQRADSAAAVEVAAPHASGCGCEAACMLSSASCSHGAGGERYARWDGERARQLGVVGACRAPQGVGSARERLRRASLLQLYAYAISACVLMRSAVVNCGQR